MPVFTARHYEVVASVLNAELRETINLGQPRTDTVMRIAARFDRTFTGDNAGFDSQRFYEAVSKGVR